MTKTPALAKSNYSALTTQSPWPSNKHVQTCTKDSKNTFSRGTTASNTGPSDP
ncbi:predicted protein [Botrytis cinerea T4]|uniref:Uncharacterized protein n=1 Tax=Botryotinia fuckeliana (strain T4) TaxID=999810 RepID=G2YH16_BOTF4|nr:predicted protein [Botrytis cinerea T4]